VTTGQAKSIVPIFPAGLPTWYPQFSAAVSNAINKMAHGSLTPAQAADAIEARAKALNAGGK
jgi:multiple sugar transport system substrate-binding protein